MTTRFYTDTNLTGYGANIEDDARVIRQIEDRARELQNQMDQLQDRWNKRVSKLESRRDAKINVEYDFRDCLA